MRYAVVVAGLLVALCTSGPAWGHGRSEPPKRVLIVVLDQLRPDLVDTFDMRNVKALMRDGVSFDNAYLGHMASETVISHNVITSGQLPRDMAGPTRHSATATTCSAPARTRCGSAGR